MIDPDSEIRDRYTEHPRQPRPCEENARLAGKTTEEILDLASASHDQQVECADGGEYSSRSESMRQPPRGRMIDLDPIRTVWSQRTSVAVGRKRGDAKQLRCVFGFTIDSDEFAVRAALSDVPHHLAHDRRVAEVATREHAEQADPKPPGCVGHQYRIWMRRGPRGYAVSDIQWSQSAHRIDQVARDVAFAPVRESQREDRGPEPL